MNDATYEAQKARIIALSDKWVNPLGFGTWTVTYEWYRESLPSIEPLEEGQAVLFRIKTEPAYMRVLLKVNLAEVQHMDDHDLERDYLHEWGHAFISNVLTVPVEGHGDARQQAIEHVCTWLGKAFRWVRVAGMTDEKKRRKAKKAAKAETTARVLVESVQ